MPDLDKAYTWAIQTCNAPNVGYSQSYRNQQTIGGVTYYDCSSFINYALLAGGWETPGYAPDSNSFTTYTEADVLIQCGFQEVNASGEILPGDIGLSGGHTEMCYQGGTGEAIFMGAHTDTVALADQVSIANYKSSFPRLFRYGDGGAAGYSSSMYVIAALCGNAWRESSINPAINEIDTGAGYGLFQWTGDRRTNLETYLASNGYDVTSAEGQLQFLIVEDDWIGSFGGISSLEEFLNSSSSDIAMLTEAFMTCWERPGVPELQQRIDYANKCFDYISANAQNPDINEWKKSNYLLTEEETLNNAVMLYRYMSAGGGGGGKPGKANKKMPVWMWIRYY